MTQGGSDDSPGYSTTSLPRLGLAIELPHTPGTPVCGGIAQSLSWD